MSRPTNFELNPSQINQGNELENTSCPIPKEDLLTLYNTPLSTQEIGRRLNRSHNSIRSWLGLLRVPMRNRALGISIALRARSANL